MFSAREISKSVKTGDWAIIDVHTRLGEMLSPITSAIMSGRDEVEIFDNELYYNMTEVSKSVWGILEGLDYEIEKLDKSGGVDGRGILISWSHL